MATKISTCVCGLGEAQVRETDCSLKLFYITWPQNPSMALKNTSTRKTHRMTEQHRSNKAQLYSQPDVRETFQIEVGWETLALVLCRKLTRTPREAHH